MKFKHFNFILCFETTLQFNVHRLNHKRRSSSTGVRIGTMPDSVEQILASYSVPDDTIGVFAAEKIIILIYYHTQTIIRNTNKIFIKHLLRLKG